MNIANLIALTYLRRLDRRLDRLRRLAEAKSGAGATWVGLTCVLENSALEGRKFRRLLLRRTVLNRGSSVSPTSGLIEG